MTVALLLAAAALVAVAAMGVAAPFVRNRTQPVEPLADPLEDERDMLLRALRELDDELEQGTLSEPEHRALRHETELRAVAVLRALEARDATGELPEQLRALRRHAPGARSVRPARGGRLAVILAASAVVVAATVALATGYVANRGMGDPITGDQNELAFFEQRVADHPNDVAARLDLAQRYLEIGDTRAVQQYLAVLELDPDNAEANAKLGFLLYRAGRTEEGLRQVEIALETAPEYPEALYYRGVILLEGLDRPEEAAASLRDYLRVAPFGAYREDAEALLARAEQS